MTAILRGVLGAAAGAGFGYLWYRLAGCRTGGCPITASPWTSMLYGAALGAAASAR